MAVCMWTRAGANNAVPTRTHRRCFTETTPKQNHRVGVVQASHDWRATTPVRRCRSDVVSTGKRVRRIYNVESVWFEWFWCMRMGCGANNAGPTRTHRRCFSETTPKQKHRVGVVHASHDWRATTSVRRCRSDVVSTVKRVRRIYNVESAWFEWCWCMWTGCGTNNAGPTQTHRRCFSHQTKPIPYYALNYSHARSIDCLEMSLKSVYERSWAVYILWLYRVLNTC
jgi:hypothetical protein